MTIYMLMQCYGQIEDKICSECGKQLHNCPECGRIIFIDGNLGIMFVIAIICVVPICLLASNHIQNRLDKKAKRKEL